MKNDNHSEKQNYIRELIAIFVVIVICPVIKQGIICNDEILLRIWSQQGMATFFKTTIYNENILKGRILGTIGNLKFLGYLSQNKYIFRTIEALFLIAAIVLCSYIFYRITKSKNYALILGILISGFLPITFELAVPNAHMIVCLQPMILLELSIVFYLNYLENSQRRCLVLSMLLLIWAMFLYEFIITYILIFPVIYFIKNINEEKVIKKTVQSVKPIILVTIIYLILYVAQGKIFPTNYEGTMFEINSIMDILRTLKRLFITALPGYYLIDPKYRYLFKVYNNGDVNIENIYNVRNLVFLIVLGLLLWKLIEVKEEHEKWNIKDSFICLTLLIYAVLPALPNALTSLYQSAVLGGDFRSIPVSIYLYCSICFLIVYIIRKIGVRKQYCKVILVTVLLICAGSIQIENNVFANEQSQNFKRIEAIEDVLRLDYWKAYGNITINAPSLYKTENTLAIEDGHWTTYASIYGNYLNIINDKSEDADLYIEMQNNNEFYVYNENYDILITKQYDEGVVFVRNIQGDDIQFKSGELIDNEKEYKIYYLNR